MTSERTLQEGSVQNPSFDPEREERHRNKNVENRDHLAKQLELLKAGKLTANDLKKSSPQ